MTKKDVSADNQRNNKSEVEENLNKEQVQDTSENIETEAEAPEEEEVEAPKEPTIEEKLAELQDRYLRLSAEYDNFRKRTLKEKIDLQKSANAYLLNELLPVADEHCGFPSQVSTHSGRQSHTCAFQVLIGSSSDYPERTSRGCTVFVIP